MMMTSDGMKFTCDGVTSTDCFGSLPGFTHLPESRMMQYQVSGRIAKAYCFAHSKRVDIYLSWKHHKNGHGAWLDIKLCVYTTAFVGFGVSKHSINRKALVGITRKMNQPFDVCVKKQK